MGALGEAGHQPKASVGEASFLLSSLEVFFVVVVVVLYPRLKIRHIGQASRRKAYKSIEVLCDMGTLQRK